MRTCPTKPGDDLWSPIAIKNSPREWLAVAGFAVVSCWFVLVYHARWRAKPYSLLTLNESLAHTAYYCIALAFALGSLYRFGLLPARAVAVRRAFGIVGVICSALHVLLTLFPLWPKYGWNYLVVKHWDLTVLGLVSLVLGFWLLKTSLGDAVQRLGAVRWRRIQLTGLALLPLVLWHFMAAGKIAKWLDWFAGRDTHPAPPGTFIIFCVGAVVIGLRTVDAACHLRMGKTDAQKPVGVFT